MPDKGFRFKSLEIQCARFKITAFTEEMAQAVHKNSLDTDTRRFLRDEVYETAEDAREAILYLISCYENADGPLAYPIILNTGENIGYVQMNPVTPGKWEVGYHIAEGYTGYGYATEAVNAFLPIILPALSLSEVWGICHGENTASQKVLEKCNFVPQSTEWGQYLGEACFVRFYRYSLKAENVRESKPDHS